MKKLLGVVFLSLPWAFCGAHVSVESITDANQSIPFKLVRGHIIVVRCSVGDLKDLIAIIDTGASETVLDLALFRKLALAGQPDHATLVAQQSQVWSVTIPRLQVGPVAADRLNGIATDLSSLTAQFGFGPQVLIGMDLLHRTNFVIDYKAHRLLLGTAPAMAHHAALVSGNSGSRFALIESTIAGRGLLLQVDSGFAGLLLYRNRVPAPITPGGGDAQIVNVARALPARTVEGEDVQVGDWRARHAQLTVVENAPPEWAEFDGLVGTAFLSKKRVAFDFENRVLYWD